MIAPREFRLVYAEDDDLFRAAVIAMLHEAGVQVHPCSDGAKAIELCETMRPDAALFDLDMPGLDGFEAARRLRRNPALLGMRLVALTGRGTLEFRMRAVDVCFDQFLCKPVGREALLQALHMAVHVAARRSHSAFRPQPSLRSPEQS